MKLRLTLLTLVLMSLPALARPVNPTQNLKISAESVSRIVDLKIPGAVGEQSAEVSIIILDNGGSTDFAPRFSLVLRYANFQEMGNTTATFNIPATLGTLESIEQNSEGVVVISGFIYEKGNEGDMKPGVLSIDFSAVVAADANMVADEGGFTDGPINAPIEVNVAYLAD